MKFICLGFYDKSKFCQMHPKERQKMMDVCFAYDDELRRGGHFVGGEVLQSTVVNVRARQGEVLVTDGPFAETKEILGGILFLEARDLQHAIELMSKHPAVNVGNIFQIHPADEAMNRLVAQRTADVANERK